MVVVQLLLRAIAQSSGLRSRLFVLPAVALTAALGAAAVAASAGGHPLHTVLSAGAHLLASSSTVTGGGPPEP